MKKTVNVVWFLNLAIADFSFTLLLPVYIALLFSGIWSELSCNPLIVFWTLNSSVSVFQLTVISVDRCICVVFPVWCHNHRRPRLAFIIALIIWIISIAVMIPYLLNTDTTQSVDLKACILNIDISIFKTMVIVSFVLHFLVPLIIIVSCYIVIIRHMRRRRIFTSSKPFKTILAIIIAFFVCWFPTHFVSFYSLFGSIEKNFYVIYFGSLIAFVLIILNCCINPVLYVFIGRDFQEKCCGSFQAKFEKAFMEDEEKEGCRNQNRNIALTRVHTQDN
ncbi:chemerin-like receptor 1 isoform 1-T2 [Anomaloglossus baeobatrachus]